MGTLKGCIVSPRRVNYVVRVEGTGRDDEGDRASPGAGGEMIPRYRSGTQSPSGRWFVKAGLAGTMKSSTASGLAGSKAGTSSVMCFARSSPDWRMPLTTHLANSYAP